MKRLFFLVISCLATGSAFAGSPVSLTDSQLDQITGGAFVCPVISTDNVLHSPNSGTLGPMDGADGEVYYTIGGPTVFAPMGATNGDGTGSPGGPYTAPGDSTYTAIWY